MQKVRKKTVAALTKALIVLGKLEAEGIKEIQEQYSELIWKISEKYNYSLTIPKILGTDEFEEFSKIKDEQVIKDFMVILIGAAMGNEFNAACMGKYRYLSDIIKALRK
jgi:hypothetical protein